jgi:hypothetical protein
MFVILAMSIGIQSKDDNFRLQFSGYGSLTYHFLSTFIRVSGCVIFPEKNIQIDNAKQLSLFAFLRRTNSRILLFAKPPSRACELGKTGS